MCIERPSRTGQLLQLPFKTHSRYMHRVHARGRSSFTAWKSWRRNMHMKEGNVGSMPTGSRIECFEPAGAMIGQFNGTMTERSSEALQLRSSQTISLPMGTGMGMPSTIRTRNWY